jgi:hypothetical protein
MAKPEIAARTTTEIADEYPKSYVWKASRNARSGRTRVLSPGPPFVISRTSVGEFIRCITPKIEETTIIGEIKGKIMYRKCCQLVAPSTEVDSRISFGIPRIPARRNSIKKGYEAHRSTNKTA